MTRLRLELTTIASSVTLPVQRKITIPKSSSEDSINGIYDRMNGRFIDVMDGALIQPVAFAQVKCEIFEFE